MIQFTPAAGRPAEMQEANFNHELLTIAREALGLTQEQLSTECGFLQANISRWESGTRTPCTDDVAVIADVLNRPLSFFYRKERPISEPTVFFHRARARTRVGDIKRIHAKINVFRLAVLSLTSQFKSWQNFIDYMPVERYESPQQIAQLVRQKWKVSPGPIRDLSGLLESAGAIIVSFDFETPDIDAIGLRSFNELPIFFVNRLAPSDRIRFSLAHELAHLVMHSLPSDSMEEEADAFAAEFLVPGENATSELANISSKNIWDLKQRWRVSGQCLLMRALDVQVIAQGRFQSMMAYFSKQGWRKREPFPIQKESPTLLSGMFGSSHESIGMSVDEIRMLTGLSLTEYEELSGRLRSVRLMSGFERKPR